MTRTCFPLDGAPNTNDMGRVMKRSTRPSFVLPLQAAMSGGSQETSGRGAKQAYGGTALLLREPIEEFFEVEIPLTRHADFNGLRGQRPKSQDGWVTKRGGTNAYPRTPV